MIFPDFINLKDTEQIKSFELIFSLDFYGMERQEEITTVHNIFNDFKEFDFTESIMEKIVIIRYTFFYIKMESPKNLLWGMGSVFFIKQRFYNC